MTPGADMWAFEALFGVTWCPTFLNREALFPVSSRMKCHRKKTNPSGALRTCCARGNTYCYKCALCHTRRASDAAISALLLFFSRFISERPLHPSAYLPSSSASFLYRFRRRLLNLPFRDVTGCHGNCLGGRGRCSNLSVRQCCQATGHMAFPSNNSTAGTCQSS